MARNSNLRVCLVVGVVLMLLLGLVLVGSGVLIYVNRDKLGKGLARLGELTKERVEDGRRFGETADQQECLAKALSYGETARSIGSDAFFLGCAATAARTEGFCDDAPGPNNVLSFAFWPQRVCAGMGRMNDSRCLQVMAAKMHVCIQQRTREESESERWSTP